MVAEAEGVEPSSRESESRVRTVIPHLNSDGAGWKTRISVVLITSKVLSLSANPAGTDERIRTSEPFRMKEVGWTTAAHQHSWSLERESNPHLQLGRLSH